MRLPFYFVTILDRRYLVCLISDLFGCLFERTFVAFACARCVILVPFAFAWHRISDSFVLVAGDAPALHVPFAFRIYVMATYCARRTVARAWPTPPVVPLLPALLRTTTRRWILLLPTCRVYSVLCRSCFARICSSPRLVVSVRFPLPRYGLLRLFVGGAFMRYHYASCTRAAHLLICYSVQAFGCLVPAPDYRL